MNCNVPRFDCWVRPEFLFGPDVPAVAEKAICFGVTALYGQALLFNVMLETGAVRGRLPIHALMQSQDTVPSLDLMDLQLWDSMSYSPSVIEWQYLSAMRCKTILRDQTWWSGEYMFTVDWYGSTEAESAGPNGWKCHHIIALDNGQYAAQPNNRILWFDPAFTNTGDPPRYKIETEFYKCERGSKWRSKDDAGAMFYGIEKLET